MTTVVWDHEKRGIRWLAGCLLAAIPTLVIAYPFLIWPFLYGEKLDGNLLNDLSIATPQASGNDLLNRIYFPFVFLITLGLVVVHGKRPSAAFMHHALSLVSVLLGFFVLSALWSDHASLTLRRAVLQCFLCYPILLACMTTNKPERILDCFYLFFCALMAINLLIILTQPAGPLGHAGLYSQKNNLGAVAALSGLFALYQFYAKAGFAKIFAIFMLAVTLFVLVASRSKTSLGLVFLAPVAGLIVALIGYYLRIAAGVFVAMAIAGLFVLFWLGQSADLWTLASLSHMIFGDPTLTARTDIWTFAREMIAQKPVFGHGFGAFWSAGADSTAFREAPGFIKKLNHAHNGYVDLLLQVGVLGFLLFVCLLVVMANLFGKIARWSFTFAWFALTCFIFVLAHNLFETTWFFGFSGVSAFIICLLALAVRLAQEPERFRVL